MASLQEIEQKLQEINDATFQQLCDEYLSLSEEYHPLLNRTGSQKGKRKTKKGTPDTYWKLPSEKYVFAEYTTKSKKDSKAAFLKKLKEDLRSCLDVNVTGVATSLIKKIILCFNSEILPKESELVKKVLGKKRIELVFISLDTIAFDIFSRHQHLAKKYLELQIDTGQVLRLQEFISQYSSVNSLNTPLDNIFYFREKEIESLIQSLNNFEIVILSGQAGVGKSKLAVEGLKQWQEKNASFGLYCLSNNNVSIFDDLKSYILPGKNFIVFIDDANRQSQNLLTILPFLKTRKSGVIKLLMTVRDYALEFVERRSNGFNYTIEKIQPLSDEQIETLLNGKDYRINNLTYIRRILQIAKGNPRVAVMSARLALKHQKLTILNDLYELYDAYFTTIITDHEFLNNIQIQKALGIISFFYTIDRSDKSGMEKLISLFDLDYYSFNEAFVILERLELVESSNDNTILKVADQILSTYFFYKCFIKDRILSFRTLLFNYFDSYKNRFSDTLIPSENDFGYEKVVDVIEADLIDYFDSISSNEEQAFQFLNGLWFCIPDHTVAFLQQKIYELSVAANPTYCVDKKNKNQLCPDDKYLKILNNFFYQNSSLLVSALEVAFSYIERKPGLYDKFFKILAGAFIFSYEDERYRFYRQDQLVSFLIRNTSKANTIYLTMFFDLFPDLMKSVYQVSNSWKKNSISFYTYPVTVNKYSKKIRKNIWKHANKYFENGLLESKDAIFSYLDSSREHQKQLLGFDLAFLIVLVNKHFENTKFIDCYYVQKLVTKCNKLEIHNPSLSLLKETYYSWPFKIYKLINMNLIRNKEEHEYETLDFDKFQRIKEIEIRYKLIFDSIDQFKLFYGTFCEITTDTHIYSWNFNTAIDIIIHETFLRNKQLAFSFLEVIQINLNPTNYIPWRIVRTITQEGNEDLEMLFNIITTSDYPSKVEWIKAFCFFVKEEDVTQQQYDALINSYQVAQYYTYYQFESLVKFKKYNQKIFATVVQIFVEKSNAGIQQALDFHFFDQYAICFKNDLKLLQETYLICEKSQQSFDHDGKDMLEILKLNNDFLIEYLKYHVDIKYSLSIREYDHLSIVWKLENAEELLRKVFHFLSSQKIYSVKEDFINAFFKNLSIESKDRAQKFLLNYLKANKKNITKVNMILNVFRNSLKEFYIKSILSFLKLNDSIEDFKKLELLNSFFLGNGEVIWHAVKASELENILIEINKLPESSKYLQHKVYLKNWITRENKRAELERKQRFMDDRW